MIPEKIAIVHDWFDTLGGAENVVEQLLNLFPQADLYSLVDFLPEKNRWIIKNKPVTTSFIQHLPFARRKFRNYLGLMPLAIEQFDLSAYPLVISSSHAFAKGFISSPGQIHISYVHTPIRYAWDLQTQYLKNARLEKGLLSWYIRHTLQQIRNWDSRSANGVDVLLANSHFTARRIWKYYRRESQVIYPPVDTNSFTMKSHKEKFFLCMSRLVHYKQVETVVEAFRSLPDQKLYVIGDGPLYKEINRSKPANVTLLGRIEKAAVAEYMQNAQALIYAAKEDFGIVPVEAQACGTPVIAYGAGGALETVRGLPDPQPTGMFFMEQTPASIAAAVPTFLANQSAFSPENCRKNAERFSNQRFLDEISDQIAAACSP